MPDHVILAGAIESSGKPKGQVLRTVASALDRLTADLTSLGAVAQDAGAERRPLTWSAQSATTQAAQSSCW